MPFSLHGCSAVLAAVLTQKGEGGEHPIVFISRMLTEAERNYTVTELEYLAVIWAIKKLRAYVEGSHFYTGS